MKENTPKLYVDYKDNILDLKIIQYEEIAKLT